MEKQVYILEWNSLDNNIDLYPHKTAEKEISEIYEELDLHNFSNALVMEEKQFKNFLKAVTLIISKLKAETTTTTKTTTKKAELTPAQEDYLLDKAEEDRREAQDIEQEKREARADLHRKYDYDYQDE